MGLLAGSMLLVGLGLAVGPPAEAETIPSALPPVAEAGTADWTEVSTGGNHSCGIRTSGRLYCWGQDSYGQLGDGGTDTNQPAPVQVFGGGTNWTAVSAGNNHTCARRSTGRLFCWGSDISGQVGDGGTNTTVTPAPVQVFGGLTSWTAVSAGYEHTCARRSTGRLYCWGSDASGQLGNGGANTNQPAPVQVFGGATNWTAVNGGRLHTCARKTTGRLFCWGSDASGQLGNGGANADQPAPVQVFGGATNWTAVNVGNDHTCARQVTGRLFCWGDDEYGQLGNGGADTDAPAPVEVFGGATNWTSVNAGRLHTCARRSTGRLFCWGSDEAGQRGDGGANTDAPAPVEVFGGATNWTAVNASGSHTCARRSTGRLFCWGFDGFGQVGDGGTNTNQPAPVQVA